MAIRWAGSVDKHGVPDEDTVHAMLEAYLYVPEFDDPRRAGSSRPDLWLGPPRRRGGPLLEVMAERVPPRDVVIFHVMEARPKFLAMLEQAEG